eukprot:m.452521 g.452521  ORF g.452521 m.452521 type:complete len:53 (-) comp20344_c0_seq1:658-816(-)
MSEKNSPVLFVCVASMQSDQPKPVNDKSRHKNQGTLFFVCRLASHDNPNLRR